MRGKPVVKTCLLLFFVAGCGAALILWPTDVPTERSDRLWQDVATEANSTMDGKRMRRVWTIITGTQAQAEGS